MACSIVLNGLLLGCESSQGGIEEVYIAPYADVTATVAEGVVTGITMAGETKFKKYQFRRGTGSMTSTLSADETTGVRYYTTEVALVFTRMESAKRTEVAALSVGQLAVIVKDKNGKLWYTTQGGYASASAGTANSGTASTDSNNYSLTLSSETPELPLEVKSEVIADVVG